MAYVGTPLDTTNAFQSLAGKRFNGDGSTTDFTLDSSPNSTLDIEVFVENVRQDPNSAYTVSGTTLAFTAAPPSGTNNIYVVHQAKAVGTIEPAVGSTLDLNGAAELILDADADTTIAADTDDQIDFKIGNADILKFTNSSSNIRIDAVVSDKDIIFGGNDGGSSTDALTLDMSDNGAATFNDDIYIYDDKGAIFGTGADYYFGTNDGESKLFIYKGGTQGAGTNEGSVCWIVGDSSETEMYMKGGETGDSTIYLQSDQADDNADSGYMKYNDAFNWAVFHDGGYDTEFKVGDDAVTTEHSISTATIDYAEFFEWKTELANDDKIKEAYGLTVVLDGDKVRLAEAGEEAKVLGVVRPSKTSLTGGDGIYWNGKYKKNVWGEDEKETYTQVNWHIFNEHGNSIKDYSYMKDRIPQYELIDSPNKDIKDWHLLESNFKKDDEGNKITLSVPSTDAEKTATKYTERTTHKTTKKTLMRRIFSDSFDQSKTYVNRSDRRKEWCVVGLIGQVPVRDSAVIPTSWTKMKNLESGIDLYYIK